MTRPEDCTCQQIMKDDPNRHFKGCPCRKVQTVVRDAGTGRFVAKEEAEKNPDTTVTEENKP